MTDIQKRDEVMRILSVMKEHYPAHVRDWRMTQELADYRIKVLQEVVEDYEQRISTGDRQTA